MTQHGKFIWNELMTRDLEGSKSFYRSVLGWDYTSVDMGTGPYTLIGSQEAPGGGIMHMQGVEFDQVPAHWMAYVEVDDVDAAAARVSEAGGSVLQPPFDVPSVGRIAIIADPSGASLGIMTSAEQG